MELNENAEIDTSQVEDARGSGGGGGFGGLPIPIGGGGLTGIIVTVVLLLVGGYFGINNLGGGGGSSGSGDNTNLNQQCKQADATKLMECRNVLYINSIQAYWATEMPEAFGKQYQKATTHIFSSRVRTGCGVADSGVGPFYCPADDKVYIDLTFYQQLAKELGAPGEFAQPYVLAHEYGHHVQDLLGTEAKMRQAQNADPGNANLESVKLELQADCYAGAWAKGASSTTDTKGQKIFTSITDADIQEGLQTAGQIGDDTLQRRNGGTINPAEFTHGTSADRQKWFRTGYDSGDPTRCDTFAPGAVKEGD
ncbi:KPN_02809 family neutral zinc metallopeptidase [Actinoplanes siamensis]|uniref:Membrane protein n=1 Tax=Actinoplanes siamensis TaxID=1223317 RepID=A0A919NAK2_9ACTN|nr:neutral zinc metallopeptidase [Actinoplanes siamensis]GIF07244.1 membrane protein [Actinoplanes siamensis]